MHLRGPLILALVMLSLAFLIATLSSAVLTGATVRSATGYDFIIEQDYGSSAIIDISLPHNPRSLSLSADVTGDGVAMVYLETDHELKMVFAVQGDASGSIERRRVLRYVCDETCGGLTNDNSITLQLIVRGATLTIHNISYTTGMPPTGAAVVDGFGEKSGVIPYWLYDALQIALTVLAVLLVVLGPLRKQGRGGRPATSSTICIIALIMAVAFMALLDMFNQDYLPSVLLGVTLACALVLDILLFREKKGNTHVLENIHLYASRRVEPDSREIQQRLESLRRRIHQ